MPRAPLSEPDQSPRELRRVAGRFHASGATIAVIGGVMAAVGFVLIALTSGAGDFVGAVLATLGVVAASAGIGLELSSLVARRASRDRPFA